MTTTEIRKDPFSQEPQPEKKSFLKRHKRAAGALVLVGAGLGVGFGLGLSGGELSKDAPRANADAVGEPFPTDAPMTSAEVATITTPSETVAEAPTSAPVLETTTEAPATSVVETRELSALTPDELTQVVQISTNPDGSVPTAEEFGPKFAQNIDTFLTAGTTKAEWDTYGFTTPGYKEDMAAQYNQPMIDGIFGDYADTYTDGQHTIDEYNGLIGLRGEALVRADAAIANGVDYALNTEFVSAKTIAESDDQTSRTVEVTLRITDNFGDLAPKIGSIDHTGTIRMEINDGRKDATSVPDSKVDVAIIGAVDGQGPFSFDLA